MLRMDDVMARGNMKFMKEGRKMRTVQTTGLQK